MKTIIILSAIIIWGFQSDILSQQYITPQQLGLKISKGNIDNSKMSSKMKDTIVIDMFNYEDDFFDIAVLYKSKNEIVVYKNCINGNLTDYKTIKLSKDASKIENDSPSERNLLFNPNLKAGIKLIYSDKTTEKISNYRINKTSDDPISKAPLRNFLDDAGVFVYDISFVEVWRSGRNGSPHRVVITGDIDNDGKNEMIYTFFPVSDSIPLFYPQRIVVFESIGNNQYRIDWDTISNNHALYTALPDITDFDRNGHKEFFAVSYDNNFNDNVAGLFECSGEGKYKFYRSDELYFQGPLRKMIYVDTVNFYNNNAGMYMCFSGSGIPSQINELAFVSKTVVGGYYFRRKTPQNIQLSGFVYDMEIIDFNNDGKNEILLGDTQFSTNYIGYLDSTGFGFPLLQGYKYMEIIPNAPVSAGWLLTKDFDGDNKKEIIVCGIGSGTGSIGVVKYLGKNNFQTMWWDSSGIVAGPNMGIDSGLIDNNFSILYPCVRYSGALDFLNLLTFSENSIYSFYQSSFRIIDSAAFLGAKFIDIDMDGKMNIITSGGIGGAFGGNQFKFHLFDFEQQGTISIQNINVELPTSFELYQNYPNPFNGQTKIKFDIHKSGDYSLRIYDPIGKEIYLLFDKYLNFGTYEMIFNAYDISTGVYFYNLKSKSYSKTRKFILIK